MCIRDRLFNGANTNQGEGDRLGYGKVNLSTVDNVIWHSMGIEPELQNSHPTLIPIRLRAGQKSKIYLEKLNSSFLLFIYIFRLLVDLVWLL